MNKLNTSKILLLAKEIEQNRRLILKTYSMSLGQDLFLKALVNNDGMIMGLLAEKINIAPPSTAKHAMKLESLGLIKRETSRLDSRHNKASLTDEGKKTIKEITLAYKELEDAFHKGLKTKDTERIEKLLDKLISKRDDKSTNAQKPKKAGKNKQLKEKKKKPNKKS